MDSQQTPSRLAVIGDVHSCAAQLERLLTKLPPGYEPVFVGDLVDRGPDPVGVLDAIIDNNFRVVRGNHDDKLYRALKGNPVQVGPDLAFTLERIRSQPAGWRERLVSWLAGLPTALVFPGIAIAHAYWSPTCPPDEHLWGPRFHDEEGTIFRVRWWDVPAYWTPGIQVVFGHYHLPVLTPHAVCVDFGAPEGPLAAYLTDTHQFIVEPPTKVARK
ncbi:metallophosphoesterase [Gloeobacter kilaueensis]|uniref:Serine/threonine protein phosphatase n=1 Tax=Gloeobacter kilaueensis (strain ATCC BAA-2537 / CCAP 1431/1 / ULC 316 / JS1) TaxID=1183438 RepID=U5QLE6_GLOK1|nr:metallophosphoesterase [Gloeobacter kilaueensis]AGY59756.1 serine/threonine protein phosphatase [Gloeobacter kilaueensis JS1]